MRNLFWGWIRTPEPDRNVQDLEKIRLQFMGLIEMIENQLSNTTYIAGEHFTIADIPMALLFYRWFNLPLERPVYEQVNRWYALVQQRPGFQKYSSDPLS